VAAKRLPHPPLKGAPGSPRYLINEFRLLEPHEGLRDTLLNKIVGQALVFDTLENMDVYRA
jgi:hypothetical protein